MSSHVVTMRYPKELLGHLVRDAHVTATVAGAANPDGTVNVTLTADAVALWVSLTTLAQGRFSDNSILLLPGVPRVLQFVPFRSGTAAEDLKTLRSSLRVEHYAQYVGWFLVACARARAHSLARLFACVSACLLLE